MICPQEHELVRSHQLGDDVFAEHLAGCAHCRDVWDGFARIIELARELPVDVPPLAHREEVRTALLASPTPSTRRSRWAVRGPVVGAIAIAAGVAIWLERPADEVPVAAPAQVAVVERPRVQIHATPGADYATESREVVRLRDGTIGLDVEPLHPGERFRVVVGDGEVEVRGTSFEVIAKADHMVGVRVTRGRVEVRPAGAKTTFLEPGQTWQVAVAIAPVTPVGPVAPAPRPAPRAIARPAPLPPPHVDAPAPPTAPAKPAPSPDEIAYNDAWDAMRAGDFRTAAAAFARVQVGQLADEAAFWHAVALARGNRTDDAIAAFRTMLDRYASSPRVGEASAMLGWLLVDTRQLDEAQRRFESAAGDRSEAVRDSARRGLDALRHH